MEINDSTGSYKVIFYQRSESEAPIALKNFNFDQKVQYVRVFGSVRFFENQRAVIGTAIQALDKYDDIPNHFL